MKTNGTIILLLMSILVVSIAVYNVSHKNNENKKEYDFNYAEQEHEELLSSQRTMRREIMKKDGEIFVVDMESVS